MTVAILGDSHAAHWYPALQAIATAHNWRLLYFSKKGCPPSEQPLRNALANRECNPWRDEALAKITAARPNLIILTGYHYATASGGVGDDLWRDGMTTTLTKLGDLAPNVVILGDTPTENADVPQCLSGHLRSVPACVSPRSYSVRSPRLQVEAELAAQFGTATIDTSDWLCTQQACPVIIGDLLVYRDRNHLTPDASHVAGAAARGGARPTRQVMPAAARRGVGLAGARRPAARRMRRRQRRRPDRHGGDHVHRARRPPSR